MEGRLHLPLDTGNGRAALDMEPASGAQLTELSWGVRPQASVLDSVEQIEAFEIV